MYEAICFQKKKKISKTFAYSIQYWIWIWKPSVHKAGDKKCLKVLSFTWLQVTQGEARVKMLKLGVLYVHVVVVTMCIRNLCTILRLYYFRRCRRCRATCSTLRSWASTSRSTGSRTRSSSPTSPGPSTPSSWYVFFYGDLNLGSLRLCDFNHLSYS